MNYWNKLVKFLIGSTGSGVRAKDSRGRFIADDKSTVEKNEAYEDGKTPAEKNKRARTKKGKYKAKPQSKARKAAAKRGRPKGSKNKKKISGHTNKKPRVGSNRSH